MTRRGARVLMLLENNPYLRDRRVRLEASELVEAGYRVSVICPRAPGERQQHRLVEGVDVYSYALPISGASALGYIGEYGYALLITFVVSFIILFRHGFDIVHAHNPPDLFFLIGGFYRLLGKKFVYDHHEVAPELYEAKFPNSQGLIYRLMLRAEKWSCQTAHCVIVTNESHRQIVVGRCGVNSETVFIVRNGPDLARFVLVEPPGHFRVEGKIVVGYVGILGQQDGLDHLLRALHHLVKNLGRTEVTCVIIGAGDALADLKCLTAELNLAEHVCFTGWIASDRELVQRLSAVDICVVPDPSNSYNDRSTMIKVMEYMALEKPIVAYDLPETRFSADAAALYARANDERDLADKLAQLMDDADKRQAMGRLGRARVEAHLAWSYSARILLQAYESLRQHTA
jgi:glycosyltransferase involved in cell wall biosynthesis